MPFKSQSQRKFFYAAESRGDLPKGTAAKWEAHTTDNFAHAAELVGLGTLAAPGISHMGGKDWSENNKVRADVAGLGILAAPSIANFASKSKRLSKAMPFLKKMV
jgi:hypothetical protein